MADKQTDDDNYMLTLAAIVKELEARGMTDSVNRGKDSSCSWASSEMGAGTEGGL